MPEHIPTVMDLYLIAKAGGIAFILQLAVERGLRKAR